jgi:hypothetical protein
VCPPPTVLTTTTSLRRKIVVATLTLSQAIDRTKADHTADDFTVGQRVKAHPATDTFMRGDVYGTIEF